MKKHFENFREQVLKCHQRRPRVSSFIFFCSSSERLNLSFSNIVIYVLEQNYYHYLLFYLHLSIQFPLLIFVIYKI